MFYFLNPVRRLLASVRRNPPASHQNGGSRSLLMSGSPKMNLASQPVNKTRSNATAHNRIYSPVHKDRARNNFPFWRPNFTISLAAPQSRNPHRRIATPPAPLNRSRPNLWQTWTSNSPIYFVHGPNIPLSIQITKHMGSLFFTSWTL